MNQKYLDPPKYSTAWEPKSIKPGNIYQHHPFRVVIRWPCHLQGVVLVLHPSLYTLENRSTPCFNSLIIIPNNHFTKAFHPKTSHEDPSPCYGRLDSTSRLSLYTKPVHSVHPVHPSGPGPMTGRRGRGWDVRALVGSWFGGVAIRFSCVKGSPLGFPGSKCPNEVASRRVCFKIEVDR